MNVLTNNIQPTVSKHSTSIGSNCVIQFCNNKKQELSNFQKVLSTENSERLASLSSPGQNQGSTSEFQMSGTGIGEQIAFLQPTMNLSSLHYPTVKINGEVEHSMSPLIWWFPKAELSTQLVLHSVPGNIICHIM